MWFYYPVLAYSIIGLPPNVNLEQLQNLQIDQKTVLIELKECYGLEYISQMLGCFRNFI